MVKIQTFESGEGREAFLRSFHDVVGRVYRDDPLHVSKAPEDFEEELFRPAFGGKQRLFLAVSPEPAARVTARISGLLDDGKPLGMLSHYESLNDAAASDAVLDAASAWLRERGCAKVIGPIDGDTWHRYRVNAGPFEHPPFFLEPYNPPYYRKLWENAGFDALEEYTSKHVPELESSLKLFEECYVQLKADGFSLRQYDPGRWEAELGLLHELSTTIFRGNFLYTDIDRQDFLQQQASIKSLLSPSDLSFLISSDGQTAGFLFAIPECRSAVAAMKGKKDLFAKLKFKWHARRPQTLNMKTLGVLPQYRRKGMSKALFYHAYVLAKARGMTSSNLCLMHKENPSQKLDGGFGRLIRTYLLYQKT